MAKCTESDSVLLANSEGKAIRFCADDSQVMRHAPKETLHQAQYCALKSTFPLVWSAAP